MSSRARRPAAPTLPDPADATPPSLGDPTPWLAAIVASSDDAILSKTLDGTITSWNAGAERIFGYTAGEILGLPMTTLIPPDRWAEEADILAKMGRGERVDQFETIRVAKDGQAVEVSVTVSPVRDQAGTIVGASKIARDIGPRKRAERDLRAAHDAAESAGRAKDHFLSVLSHELRTPLTPALTAVTLLEEAAELPTADRVRLAAVARRNIEAEARLVDDLLDVTRIGQGKLWLQPVAVDANAAVRQAVEALQGPAGDKRLEVSLMLRAQSPLVWVDPARLQQVLLNLLGNAVKFTPAGGRVTIRTADDRSAAGPGVRIEVADTGVGIDADAVPRLFVPFEQGDRTTNRRFGGLGLGLSIVRSLVELHGGSATAASDGPGRGATFTVWLPAAPTAAAVALPVRAPPPTMALPLRDGFRVLLVEDHADTRKVMTRVLSTFGCAVTSAATVADAMALLDVEGFDLLVSDIGLPDGTGLDVMRHAGAKRATRGIALSGFGQDDDLRRSIEAGFSRHLTKPVNVKMLRDVIQQVAC